MPAAGTVTVPALESANAGAVPEVVVSERSPKVVVPPTGSVVLIMLTPPLAEPVTVMSSKTLVPMLVPAASSPAWRRRW